MKLNRRKSALKRLEAQLKSNKKPVNVLDLISNKVGIEMIALDEKDVKRIKKEIEILKVKTS